MFNVFSKFFVFIKDFLLTSLSRYLCKRVYLLNVRFVNHLNFLKKLENELGKFDGYKLFNFEFPHNFRRIL